MKGLGKLLTAFITLALASSFALTAKAATLGTDNANQAVYDDGWQTGDDGAATGDAFGAWTLSISDIAGHFIGDSTVLSAPGADINVGGESWGMFGATPGFAAADRGFTGGGLSVGQTFSIELAVNFRNGFKGIDVKDGATTIFNFNIGGDDYVVTTNGTAFGSIGSTYSANTEFLLSFEQTSAGGGTWTIIRSGGVADSDSGSYSGTPDNIRLYVGSTGGGDPNNLYANSMAIIPEPSTIALVGLGLIGALALRRRKA
jgi:hypothetical protein